MKRLTLSLLFFCLPLAALADGMVIPSVAYPATVTIPDQRAMICFSNSVERLVIETRFAGAGTNFAWVVPLPSPPVVEEATTGLFPTLQYLFRPEIVHNPTRYYAGVLALLGIGYLILFVRPTGELKWLDAVACVCISVAAGSNPERDIFNVMAFLFVLTVFFGGVVLVRIARMAVLEVVIYALGFFCVVGMLFPALGAAKMRGINAESAGTVSVLERRILGEYETATISSRDAGALGTWLSENGFSTPANAGPVIAGYVKNGWVFVATKVRRDSTALNTNTPQPLSFTFKTSRPVYPMQLTGLNGQPLTVDLYFWGQARATARHFRVESCLRPNVQHPLLQQWTAGLPICTKLTATLSPSDMRQDVWLMQTPIITEQKSRLFSRQGAVITALNWTLGVFALGLATIHGLRFANSKEKTPLSRLMSPLVVSSLVLGGVVYAALPKIEVRLVKGGNFYLRNEARMRQMTVLYALQNFEWHTTTEARNGLRDIFSDPKKAAEYGVRTGNSYVGGHFREEDSPGNYLLRETNHQLQIVVFNADGAEEIADTLDFPP